MRYYELVFIARQDLTPAQVEGMTKQYTSVIQEQGGEVSKTEFCGLRTLAYPIRKNSKGNYVLLNVAIQPLGMKEVERQMKINEDILRYLSVRVAKLDNHPSPLMQQRNYKEEMNRKVDDFEIE
jgi:small subunit ribosomal protein S6